MGSEYVADTQPIPPEPKTGKPRNPGGMTGAGGKGHLPSWGPNAAIILIVTRYADVATSLGFGFGQAENNLEYVLYVQRMAQFPWVSHIDFLKSVVYYRCLCHTAIQIQLSNLHYQIHS